jgi:hypothetical protein
MNFYKKVGIITSIDIKKGSEIFPTLFIFEQN